jgi:hypothetical protein
VEKLEECSMRKLEECSMRKLAFYISFILIFLTAASEANIQPSETRAPQMVGDIIVDWAPVLFSAMKFKSTYPMTDQGYNDVVGDPAAASFYARVANDGDTRPPGVPVPATDEASLPFPGS